VDSWTVKMVEERLIEAAAVMRRLRCRIATAARLACVRPQARFAKSAGFLSPPPVGARARLLQHLA
jgi:hypothetical protein